MMWIKGTFQIISLHLNLNCNLNSHFFQSNNHVTLKPITQSWNTFFKNILHMKSGLSCECMKCDFSQLKGYYIKWSELSIIISWLVVTWPVMLWFDWSYTWLSLPWALSLEGDDSDGYKWSLIGKSREGRRERERERERKKREYCNPGLSFVFVFAEWFVFASWLMVSLPSKMFPINLDIKNSSGQSQEFLLWRWSSHSCHVDISRNTAREHGGGDERCW